MIDHLLAIIAPHLCCGCGKVGSLLCDGCKDDIVNEPSGRCIVCEQPTGAYLCRHHSDHIADGWYVAERTGVLETVIDRYKFGRTRAAHEPLASLLATRLPDFPADTVVVPIPTITPHIRVRGYDHMTLIATRLAKKRGWRTQPILLRRTNSRQRGATRAERQRQAQSAYRVDKKLDSSLPYLIIDDVATTGATLRAAAAALHSAGARIIYVAAIARQPLD